MALLDTNMFQFISSDISVKIPVTNTSHVMCLHTRHGHDTHIAMRVYERLSTTQ